MFERRLKIFLGILIGITILLLAHSAQVQVLDSEDWAKSEAEALRRYQDLQTTRGEILDCKGRRLAYDQACMDAAVDFRAIERNDKWMKDQAIARLLARNSGDYRGADRAERRAMIDEELVRLNAELDAMWHTLAQEVGRTTEEMDQLQAAIRRRVEMRRRQVWYARYEQAMRRHADREPEPWYAQWLLSGEPAPQLDSFAIEVGEQTDAHAILTNISAETHNRLKKRLEQFPGLVIRPSTHRFYPYGAVACHVLGHLSLASPEDLKNDPNLADDLRKYRPNDLVGAAGVEAMCEQVLRGTRGRNEYQAGHDEPLSTQEPRPGRDVRITIDIELQAKIEEAFKHVVWKDDKTDEIVEEHEMHGAVVVLDVATREVRALVSYPTYDLNHLEDLYPRLATDVYNQPLLNRATQMAIEPGSTVKPMVGLSAVTQGVIRPTDTIECKGYMYHNGHQVPFGRCWTVTMYGGLGLDDTHHKIPWQDPHPNGFLTLTEAIQRSCNPFFETLGERLGVDGLRYWFTRFGLGRPTGIGLNEASGTLPHSNIFTTAWYGGIGQGEVLATPLQMANVVATIARDGIWMRPRLVSEADRGPRPTSRPASTQPATPDRVDLRLAPNALAAVKEGMWRVVNTTAGSGKKMHRDNIAVAGKTGTAQTGPLSVPKRDADGKLVRDPGTGRIEREEPPPINTREHPNPTLAWYRGSGHSGEDLAHAWFISFAPARDPKIAFSVVLEYGGSGGGDAAPVVNAVLDALIEHGYLPTDK